MRIPYVIDNINNTLADVLNYLLQQQPGQQMDIATAYFSIRGFGQVRETLPNLRHFRLLLGDSPQEPGDIGVRPDAAAFLRGELNAEPLSLHTQQLVEDLIRFLRRDDVEVRLYLGHDPSDEGRRQFLHAKCYLMYGGRGDQQGLFDYLNPLIGIVGSSNFTGPGLTSNRELNMVHKTLLSEEEIEDAQARTEVAYHAQAKVNVNITADNQYLLKSEVGARAIIELATWYSNEWEQAIEYKEDLIQLLENSKFGGREYTPYEIYMKALYEYFKDDLDTDFSTPSTRSAVELTEFQEDAVKKARRILARYDGVLVGDSVGLGKTWIGKKLLEDYAYHLRQKTLIVCPASLKAMWEGELRSATIAGQVLTQERLGQKDFDIRDLRDVDVILVDEAHNFRNRHTMRYQNLETIIAANGRRGRDGGRKKVILLTATPINNSIFDLYNQINLFAGNDPAYFASAGIGDLFRYFVAARRASVEEGSIKVFNLLEEVVIRRTRQFIKTAYPEATIHGKTITWPERRLRTMEYNLENTYQGFYQEIVRHITGLNLAHYNLESYKKKAEEQDDLELGRQEALVGIFKSRFLKRLESSIDSFRISIRRALEFVSTFAEYVQDDIVLDSSSFQEALRLLIEDDEDTDDIPKSRAEEIDHSEAARELIGGLPRLDPTKYDRRKLYKALQDDVERLRSIWTQIEQVDTANDAKLQALADLLKDELRGQKVLIFTYYRDTARYLYRALNSEAFEDWRNMLGNPNIRRIDSSIRSVDRPSIVESFAPLANNLPADRDTSQDIDILIATDVMSEGQNLQDCGHLINYDLHWNPTRMVQRAGRIDRLGSKYEILSIYNLFPERKLEELLGLVKSLTSKIDTINQTGFLDASILGEVVTPRDFNTLKRIAQEDSQVIEEQEAFLELASSEMLLARLQSILATEARKWLTDLDDGIHSGIERQGARGVFFYFRASNAEGAGHDHFWRYYDLVRREIVDNRYQIMQVIACGPETLRFPPPYSEVDIYDIQEKVLAHILEQIEYRQAVSAAPKSVADEQTTISEILRSYANHPDFDRDEIRSLRRFLGQPLIGAHIKRLRNALKEYTASEQIDSLIETLRDIQAQDGFEPDEPQDPRNYKSISRDDLHLVCYEYVWN